jgi:Flp pilus assembly CpaF family ATPase
MVDRTPNPGAYDLLEALNTGHDKSLSTIHANSAGQALHRFASCAFRSGVEVPYDVLRQQIAACVHLIRSSGTPSGTTARRRGVADHHVATSGPVNRSGTVSV